MRLVIVTEFQQEGYFQWRDVWTDARQKKYGVQVTSLEASPCHMELHKDTRSAYWKPLKDADVVFVYCSRFDRTWEWFRLPCFIKKYMNPKTIMIVQFDTEFLWMVNKGGMNWDKKWDLARYEGKTPETIFKETGVLNVGDGYFTVLESPFWGEYCEKPVFYMPLPQLLRYKNSMSYPNKHDTRNIGVIHHSSRLGMIDHTIENVIKPLGRPLSLFTCSTKWTNQQCIKYGVERGFHSASRVYGYLFGQKYMEYLHKCHIAIEDTENYFGWSRFVMECALLYVPCIGSKFANKLFFPELYTEHKDYEAQIKLVKKLYASRQFHRKIATEGRERVLRQLDPDMLCKRFIAIVKAVKHQKVYKGKRNCITEITGVQK